MAVDSLVCFHRWLFADPVKPPWCITGSADPLESINQNWCDVKLQPMSILTYPVLRLCVSMLPIGNIGPLSVP